MISGATMGNIAWKSLTGQSVVNVSLAKPQDLTAAAKRSELDQSHLPEDKADLSDADRLAIQEQKANKHLKSFFAAATVFEGTVRSLGQLGSFWGMIQGVMGSGVHGWLAVGAGAGAAMTITDAAFQVKTAAVNRNLSAAIEGSFSMVQGMGVMLSAMGLGRIPALVAVGAAAGKMIYGMYRAGKAEKEKEEQEKAAEAEKAAQKAQQQQQPQPQQVTPVTAPSQPVVAAPAQPTPTP